MTSQLVWFITGASTGFGREFVIAALERGDKVIATTRGSSMSKLDDLKAKGAGILELDVTAPFDDIKKVAEKATTIHGRIDVLVNNAGYILTGATEANTHEEAYQQFNTNVFGALNVTRALLPHMRERKSGTIVFLGSVAGWISSPGVSLYSATKYALRGISTTLHEEISPLGLRSICIEPGFFRTQLLSSTNRTRQVTQIPDYQEMVDGANTILEGLSGKQPGDPQKCVNVIINVVRAENEARGKPFPTVLALGSDCYQVVKQYTEGTLKRLEDWKEVTCSTEFDIGHSETLVRARI